MSVFADSSAIVKLYVPEPGAGSVRGVRDLVVSALARVEVVGALMRKRRLEELGPGATEIALKGFDSDWRGTAATSRRFAVVGAGDALLERAAGIARTLPLRAYDAIQLASLETATDAGVEIEAFACFDRGLREAAAQRGHALLPAALEPLSP